MRDIPLLQTLCLRSVGSQACSAEATFCQPHFEYQRKKTDNDDDDDDKPVLPARTTLTMASRLLRRFHDASSGLVRTPCIGPGSVRRQHANEVDLNHPVIGAYYYHDHGVHAGVPAPGSSSNGNAAVILANTLVMEYGSAALDLMQSYIDALMELGRMDDNRVGVHFFTEYKIQIELAAGLVLADTEAENHTPVGKTKRKKTSRNVKRKRSTINEEADNSSNRNPVNASDALGSLSLYNCTIASETVDALVASQLGSRLAVLDLGGTTLQDAHLEQLLPALTSLRRLSLKNCRRITDASLDALATTTTRARHSLYALDLGGAFNCTVARVVQLVPLLPQLVELHASGLGWSNETVQDLLVTTDRAFTKLSLGFAPTLTAGPLRNALLRKVANTLVSLALPFCEPLFDNALLGALGRNVPWLQYLDVRGNIHLTSLTGWYDGRVSANLESKPGVMPPGLHVLGRYSGLTAASVEETQRVHPIEAANLVVVLDGTGTGLGITRTVMAGGGDDVGSDQPIKVDNGAMDEDGHDA